MFSKEDVEELLIQNGFIILQSLEIQEPDFELNGELVKMESLVVEAIKRIISFKILNYTLLHPETKLIKKHSFGLG